MSVVDPNDSLRPILILVGCIPDSTIMPDDSCWRCTRCWYSSDDSILEGRAGREVRRG